MPASLVSRIGLRSELAEYKSVLRDVRDQVMVAVDAEAMARELVASGGREYVDLVRELTTALASVKKELAAANQRCARLESELERRGISLEDEGRPGDGQHGGASSSADSGPVPEEPGAPSADGAAEPAVDPEAEWEAWDRRFQALLG